MLAAKNPSYFGLAQVQGLLEAPHRSIALSYLRASWQVENREAVCRRFLAKAHEHFLAALAEMKSEDPKRTDVILLCGEVERRLEKWDAAERRFRDLREAGDFKSPMMLSIITMQLKLIERRDSHPRALDETIQEPKAPLGEPPAAPPNPLRLEQSGRVGQPGLGL